MKSSFLLFFVLASFNLMAKESRDLRRAPAVVVEECDPNTMNESETFSSKIFHKVIIHSDAKSGCSVLPKAYEENARNEIKHLFQKNPDKYSKNCTEYFKNLNLNNDQFECNTPEIISMTFSATECIRQVEDGTQEVRYASSAVAEIKYEQKGKKLVEKSSTIIAQSARVNKCIEQTTALTTRVPGIARNSKFFDGNREPKNNSNPDKENQEKNSEKDSAKK